MFRFSKMLSAHILLCIWFIYCTFSGASIIVILYYRNKTTTPDYLTYGPTRRSFKFKKSIQKKKPHSQKWQSFQFQVFKKKIDVSEFSIVIHVLFSEFLFYPINFFVNEVLLFFYKYKNKFWKEYYTFCRMEKPRGNETNNTHLNSDYQQFNSQSTQNFGSYQTNSTNYMPNNSQMNLRTPILNVCNSPINNFQYRFNANRTSPYVAHSPFRSPSQITNSDFLFQNASISPVTQNLNSINIISPSNSTKRKASTNLFTVPKRKVTIQFLENFHINFSFF
jgi:hypothetical protein